MAARRALTPHHLLLRHGNRWSARCGRGAVKIGMVETLRLREAISIEFKTRGPGEVHRYSGSHLAVSGGPPTPPVRWSRVPYRKTPARGFRGRVCLSENQVGWGLEFHPPMPPPGGIAGMFDLGSGFSATIASVVTRSQPPMRRPAAHAAPPWLGR